MLRLLGVAMAAVLVVTGCSTPDNNVPSAGGDAKIGAIADINPQDPATLRQVLGAPPTDAGGAVPAPAAAAPAAGGPPLAAGGGLGMELDEIPGGGTGLGCILRHGPGRAKEFAASGITVNAIAPGFIATDMTDELSDKVKEAIKANIPMRKFGEVDDIAEAVAYLAGPGARYVTGQVLTVDGGMVM